MEQLRDVFHQMKHDFLPQCTYCVNSGHGPVSYTHLDVYKRQVMDCICIISLRSQYRYTDICKTS